MNYRPPPLHGILIENRYTEQKQLELLVERDGNIVHWNTRTIPTLGKKKDGGWTGVVIAIRDREWMGCGTYEITARLPNESESGTLDFRNLEPESGDNGKFRPVEVRIEFSNEWDGLAIDTTRLDDPVIDCEETNTETRTTQR